MARIQIAGAGGAPSNNVIRSLREARPDDTLIGTSSTPTDLFLADVDERHVVPHASDPDYEATILGLLEKTCPDFLHAQNDFEVRAISRIRDKIHSLGVRTLLPEPSTVENCVDKYLSYEIWRDAGLRVPRTALLRDANDLRTAFEALGETIWIRATEGGGGQGALPTDDYEFARKWIDRFNGWGKFTAAELLTAGSVTWLSVWFHGQLVVAQGRRRRNWNFGSRTLSGVTGITGVAETVSDPAVDRTAQEAILSVDSQPHGIFGVDMTYDGAGAPNITEINIGRFFTTVYFFTKAGLNMPAIYVALGLGEDTPRIEKPINPLPAGLMWIRGMDTDPVLTSASEMASKVAAWSTSTCLTP